MNCWEDIVLKRDDKKIKTPEETYEVASLELALYRIMRRDHDSIKAAMSADDEEELSRIAKKKCHECYA